MRFKIDWPSLLLGRKFTVFLCFTLYLRAIFKYKSRGGGLYLEGRFNERFFALQVCGGFYLEGLIFPKKVASIKKHSLPLPQSWEGVLSVSCLSFSTPTMQTKLKAAMETKRNKAGEI